MNAGPTFDRVYVALKRKLSEGCYAPGQHLEPALIGDELHSSVTPVRDALHRLAGERIVETPRSDGFRVPAPSEAELRGLYGWNGLMLDVALRSRPFQPDGPGAATGDEQSPGTAMATARLFASIARRSSHHELRLAIDNLNDRLGAFRQVEARIMSEVEDELAGLHAAFEAADLAALRRLVAAYHRKRQRLAPAVLEAAWTRALRP